MDDFTESTRYAVLALSNLAANINSHGLIMDEIQVGLCGLAAFASASSPSNMLLQMQLNAFFELASSKDVEVQRYFSMMLSNLASNEDLHEFLSSRACFQAVNSILLADSMETVVSALGFVLSVLRGGAASMTYPSTPSSYPFRR